MNRDRSKNVQSSFKAINLRAVRSFFGLSFLSASVLALRVGEANASPETVGVIVSAVSTKELVLA